MVAARDLVGPTALRTASRSVAGAWASSSVALPGRLTMVVALSDTTVLAGGVAPDSTGWVQTVSGSGAVLARGVHAAPPVRACVMDGLVVVHGADGNLSVLHPRLESLWDQASRFTSPVALLSLDYDGDGFDDAALVGVRTVTSSKPRPTA